MAYRVLSLDGGGVWALVQVRALIALYSATTTGREVLSDFDLVAANSGGSIVLGGLIEDLPLGSVLAYFETESLRRSIFQPTDKSLLGLINGLANFGPKYSAKAKLPALNALMPRTGGLPLSNAIAGVCRNGATADVHILITAFDFDRNCASFFRSSGASGPEWGSGASTNATVSQAIHASSNAPVDYFDEPALIGDGRYWDGAIAGCNNPVLAGVAEAIVLGQKQDNIVALSLGTGVRRLPGPPAQHPTSALMAAQSPQGFPIDIAKLAASITDDPPDVASFLAHVFTNSDAKPNSPAVSRIVRMNPMISPTFNQSTQTWLPPGTWTPEQFNYLANDVHLDALDQNQVDYISSYTEWWLSDAVPNEPIRMNSDTLVCELGYQTFSQAAAAWAAIK